MNREDQTTAKSRSHPAAVLQLRRMFGSAIFALLVLTLLIVGAISYRGLVVASESDRWCGTPPGS
jgi:hypothetical protein